MRQFCCITLSSSQVHRLVSHTPERLSLPVLAALCDKTATRLVIEAGGTWSRYAPGAHER